MTDTTATTRRSVIVGKGAGRTYHVAAPDADTTACGRPVAADVPADALDGRALCTRCATAITPDADTATPTPADTATPADDTPTPRRRAGRAPSTTATVYARPGVVGALGGAVPMGARRVRRARTTGAIVAALNTEQADLDTATPWVTACLTHGTNVAANDRRSAVRAIPHPESFCDGCRAIADGRAPRVTAEPAADAADDTR